MSGHVRIEENETGELVYRVTSHRRTITETDIVNFVNLVGLPRTAVHRHGVGRSKLPGIHNKRFAPAPLLISLGNGTRRDLDHGGRGRHHRDGRGSAASTGWSASKRRCRAPRSPATRCGVELEARVDRRTNDAGRRWSRCSTSRQQPARRARRELRGEGRLRPRRSSGTAAMSRTSVEVIKEIGVSGPGVGKQPCRPLADRRDPQTFCSSIRRVMLPTLAPPAKPTTGRSADRSQMRCGFSAVLAGGLGSDNERFNSPGDFRPLAPEVSTRPGQFHYATSAPVFGRNPKLVAAELGHTTSRMVVEVYDSFPDPVNWPGELERARLVRLYGWPDLAPPQHPRVQAGHRHQTPPMQRTDGATESGAPGTTRTCDLQVRNLTLYPTELRARTNGNEALNLAYPVEAGSVAERAV